MGKFLIALSYWEGDRAQALKLARLMADVLPAHQDVADFLFVPRFDCSIDRPTVSHVSRKFNVHTYVSPKQSIGWPGGCNGTWYSTVEWCYRNILGAKVPAYDFFFNIAADTIPLTSGYLHFLRMAFDLRPSKTFVGGALIPKDENRAIDHINGDAMLISCEKKFLHWLVNRAGGLRGVGWDYALANEFKQRGWFDIPGIRSQWRRPSIDEHEWDALVAEGTRFLHGIKDDSALDLARQKLPVL